MLPPLRLPRRTTRSPARAARRLAPAPPTWRAVSGAPPGSAAAAVRLLDLDLQPLVPARSAPHLEGPADGGGPRLVPGDDDAQLPVQGDRAHLDVRAVGRRPELLRVRRPD